MSNLMAAFNLRLQLFGSVQPVILDLCGIDTQVMQWLIDTG